MSSLANSLDYSPLNQEVSQQDVALYEEFKKAAASERAKRNAAEVNPKVVRTILIIIGAFFFLVVIVPLIAAIVTAVTQGNSSQLGSYGFFGIIVGITIVILTIAAQRRKKQLAKLYKFVVRNNMALRADYSPLPGEYTGMIFDEGHSHMVKEALVLPDGNELGNYEYVTGSGKNRQTHAWSYARIKLSRRLPHMVLDAKKNNFFGGRFSNLPDTLNKDQTLSLEGDFNNHFTLYAPKQYEQDALYVFTPDVMGAMVDAAQAYDMEVIDDSLMLYTKTKIKLDSEQDLRTLLTILDQIGDELRQQSRRYADERIGDKTVNIIAEPGRRLKGGISWVLVAFIVFTVVFMIFSFSMSN